ncbi:MAG: MMPL family transporter [bacterium]|nr:MMPL family transporter [bacterium]
MKKSLFRSPGAWGLRWVIDHRWFWLLLWISLLAAALPGLERLHFDSSNESFLPEGDQVEQVNQRFKEIFGNEEFAVVLIEAQDPFSKASILRLKALQRDLEAHLPFLDEIDSLADLEYLEAVDGNLENKVLFPETYGGTPREKAGVRAALERSRLFKGKLVTDDLQDSLLSIRFQHVPASVWVPAQEGFLPIQEAQWPDEKVLMASDLYYSVEEAPDGAVEVLDPRKLVAPALDVILKRHRSKNFELSATGVSVMDYRVDLLVAAENAKVLGLALGASALFLMLLYRHWAAVIAPLAVIVSVVLLLFGGLGWIGATLSMASLIVGPLVMVLSVSYSVHLINHFNYARRLGNVRRDALAYTWDEGSWPVFLTALTTAAGFASFWVVPLAPVRDLGLACALGALLAFGLAWLLVPLGLSFGPETAPVIDFRNQNRLSRWREFGQAVTARRKAILWLFLLISLAAVPLALSVRVESDIAGILGDQTEIMMESRRITEKLGGLYSYELMVELPEADQAKDPEVLKVMEQMARRAQALPGASSSFSLVDLIKELNEVMNDRSAGSYRIPESPELIAQYLLLYEMSGGQSLYQWVDYGYRRLRLSVQVAALGNLGPELEALRAQAQAQLPPGTRVTLVGDLPILLRVMDLLVLGQAQSVLAALGSVGLLMILVLKSLKAGLLSLLPNLFPLLVSLAFMGLCDWSLNVFTVMNAPMLLGIAVDDTLHFFLHFRQETLENVLGERAIEATFEKIGGALLGTTVVLTLGFGLFTTSSIQGLVGLGAVSAVGILAALIADFFLTPALLAVFKPFEP